MVGDVVVGLKPNPLLPFGKESVVAGLSLTILHYYRHTIRRSTLFTVWKLRRKPIIADQLTLNMWGDRAVLTVFMAFCQCFQVIYVVIVISRCTQNLKWEVTYNWWSSGQRKCKCNWDVENQTFFFCRSIKWVIFTHYLWTNNHKASKVQKSVGVHFSEGSKQFALKSSTNWKNEKQTVETSYDLEN